MSMNSIIIGYSGHAYVVLDIIHANGIKCNSYCEHEEKVVNPFNLQYLGSEKNPKLLDYLSKHNIYVSIGENTSRSKVVNYLEQQNLTIPFLSHPSSIISPSSKFEDATIIMPGVVINALVKIGRGVICNTSCIVEHECSVGDFSHIAPGAVLAGNVSIGRNCFIGSNSIIKQGVSIGDNVIIGAGSVVLDDVLDNCIVYGNPAKLKSK
jgi:sugar O-acyltransferase (sialic acid O-acetyltransferase NeuD family)